MAQSCREDGLYLGCQGVVVFIITQWKGKTRIVKAIRIL